MAEVGDYVIGERIEVQTGPRWYPGVISNITYIVKKNTPRARPMKRTGDQIKYQNTETLGDMRYLTSYHFDHSIHIPIGSAIQIEMGINNWEPGTVVGKEYSVLTQDGDSGGILSPDIRRPNNAPALNAAQIASIRRHYRLESEMQHAMAAAERSYNNSIRSRYVQAEQAEIDRTVQMYRQRVREIREQYSEVEPAEEYFAAAAAAEQNLDDDDVDAFFDAEDARIAATAAAEQNLDDDDDVDAFFAAEDARIAATATARGEQPQELDREIQNFREQVRRIREHNAAALATARVEQPRRVAEQPQGVAYEIHNAFADFKFDQFMEIINRLNGTRNKYKNNDNPLLPLIIHSKNNEDLIRVSRRLSTYEKLGENKKNITACIQYVLTQPPVFIDNYIQIYIKDCILAYNSGNNTMSCIKGIYERIYYAFRDTIAVVCSSPDTCKPEYDELLNCFNVLPSFNDIFKEWSLQYNSEREDHFNQTKYDTFIGLPTEDKKEFFKSSFQDFVRNINTNTNYKLTPAQIEMLLNDEKFNRDINKAASTIEHVILGGKRKTQHRRAKHNKTKKRMLRKK